MADVTNDGLVFHFSHVIMSNHVVVTGCRDKNISVFRGVIHGHHAVAFHGSLQGTNRINLGHPNLRRQGAQSLCRTFTHIAVTGYYRHFTGDHHVRGTLNRVH